MTTPNSNHAIRQQLETPRRQVRARLAGLRAAIRRELILEGIAWIVTVTAALAAVLLLVDWLFRPELPTRFSILPLAMAAVAVIAWRKLVRPLTVPIDELDLAAFLDRRQPGLGQRIATVMQLPQLLEGEPQASPQMISAAVLADARRLEQTDFPAMLDRRRRIRFGSLFAAAVLLPGLFCLVAPRAAELWAARWLAGSDRRWPQHNYLAVLGLDSAGRLTVPRGEPVIVQVESRPAFEKVAAGWMLPGRRERIVVPGAEPPTTDIPAQVQLRYRDEVAGPKQSTFTRTGESRFRYEMPPVLDPVEITISGGDDWLAPVLVRPVDRPAIESLVLLATGPGEAGSEPQKFDGAENTLLFLRGTTFELQLKSRQPLASAKLLAKEGQAPEIARVDDRTYHGQWTMDQPVTLEIQMIGREGQLASKPAYLSIGLLKDREPRVTLRSSGVGRRVTPQATIPLNLRAVDDFGVATLALEMERIIPSETAPRTDANRIDLPPAQPASAEKPAVVAKPPTDDQRDQDVSLIEYKLASGSLVKIRGAAADQCHEGVQTGVSRWLTFQIVSPEELFYDILMRQRAQRAKFTKAVEMAKTQTASIDADTTPDAAPGLIRTHQVVARQVWEVGNRLDGTLVEMRLNQLGTPQALELLDTKVIKPLRELHAGPLTQLRPILDQLGSDPTQFAAALAVARPLQHEVLARMQRILIQMSQWESFVDVMNQLDEITKLQQSVLETTEQKRKASTQDIFDE